MRIIFRVGWCRFYWRCFNYLFSVTVGVTFDDFWWFWFRRRCWLWQQRLYIWHPRYFSNSKLNNLSFYIFMPDRLKFMQRLTVSEPLLVFNNRTTTWVQSTCTYMSVFLSAATLCVRWWRWTYAIANKAIHLLNFIFKHLSCSAVTKIFVFIHFSQLLIQWFISKALWDYEL